MFRKESTDAPFCQIFLAELNPCQTWYTSVDQVTGRVLDVPATFAPTGLHAILFKLILTMLTLGSLAYCFLETDDRPFFFTKFTFIALLLQCIYHLVSFSNSTCPTLKQPQEGIVRGRARLTWYLFNMSLHATIVAALLFWVLDYQASDKLSLLTLLPHGPTVILTLVDGFWINRIPIRLFHWWSAVLPLQLGYTGWTLLHAYLEIGNPTRTENDSESNDDAIYRDIVWKSDPVETLIRFVVVILAVGPAIQFILFLLSLYSWPLCCRGDCRRYTTSAAAFAEQRSLELKSTASQSHAEEGSIFANWR